MQTPPVYWTDPAAGPPNNASPVDTWLIVSYLVDECDGDARSEVDKEAPPGPPQLYGIYS